MKAWTTKMLMTVVASSAVACDGSVDINGGLFEPIVVHEAQLHGEHLKVSAAPQVSKVISVESASQVLVHGQQGRTLSGRVSADAYAVAVRVQNQGTNWWVVPAGSLDPDFPDQRAFSLEYDVNTSLPAGSHELAVAAIDENGEIGEVSALSVCVLDDSQPGKFNPCDPRQAPPALAINLQWNTNVDLDLVVRTPTGETIAWKTPATATPAGQKPAGRLLRDSNPHCHLDRRNSESVVFEREFAPGIYSIYVNLAAACGESGVLFSTQAQRAVSLEDGTYGQSEVFRVNGAFIAQQASNFANQPLYVGSVEVR